MSVTVSLAELADIAFGTADGGSPQLGALCELLRGLLEHLHPQEAVAGVRKDERGLLEPTASVAGGKNSSFHQQPWLGRAKGQQSHPSGSSGTAELPALGPAATKEWQMVQLKKRIEVTEEGMTKVMDMLQEMFTTIGSLKTTIDGFREELQLLKDSFQKTGLEGVREWSVRQDERGHLLQSMLDQLLSHQELSPEASQELPHEASCRLSWLLEQQKAMGTHVGHTESQLQQHADSGTLEGVAAQLEKKPDEMRQQQDGGEKGLDFDREMLGQVGHLQEQCTKLQEAMERLWGDPKDTQKADKAVLELRASQEELQHAMVQLSELMQDVLQRMSLLEQDREKTLKRLLSKMDSKLDCAALTPLQAQLEQMWRLTQQCLCQGTCCGAIHAAGFKRQHFDPVKCISCDRPLAVDPAPHLVTTRKASQRLQTQLASAGGSNCPPRRLPQRESTGSGRASCGPASPTRPLSASSSIVTLCPCREPADCICKSKEVDILGINGVVYKGRLNPPAAIRSIAVGTDIPVRQAPRPRSRHTAEKMQSRPEYGSHYVSPYSCAAVRMKMGSSGGRWQPATGGGRTAGV